MKTELLVLACFAALCAVTRAVPCTPQTCDGPVMVYFEYSNCTGDVMYDSIDVSGTCDHGQIVTMDDLGLVYLSYEASDCISSPDSRTRDTYVFGLCGAIEGNRGAGMHGVSRIALAHVNDSYASPQAAFDNQPLPAYEDVDTECYSTGNCTLPDGSAPAWYLTSYSDFNCSGDSYSIMPAHTTLGTCYNYENKSYIKYECSGENGFLATYHTQSTCSNAPFLTTQYSSTCGQASRYSFHCNSQSEQPAQPTPSSASTLAAYGYILSIGILAAFVY
jgi:hypothetical protein